jgi:hypothetical protein
MLYKFKSKAVGDLIMLEPNGRANCCIIGKDPAPKGICSRPTARRPSRRWKAAIERTRRSASPPPMRRERRGRAQCRAGADSWCHCASAPSPSSTCCAAAEARGRDS